MDELFIETKNGNIPIDREIVQKYNLKKGTLSPFSGGHIVGKFGDFAPEKPKDPPKHGPDEKTDDDMIEMDNGMMLTTSEIIDISEGADSDTEET